MILLYVSCRSHQAYCRKASSPLEPQKYGKKRAARTGVKISWKIYRGAHFYETRVTQCLYHDCGQHKCCERLPPQAKSIGSRAVFACVFAWILYAFLRLPVQPQWLATS